MNVSLCIPLCQPSFLPTLRSALARQTLQPATALLLDSAPVPVRAEEWPFGPRRRIHPAAFDHGGSRRQAIDWLPEAEVIVFLTQDACLDDPMALEHLLHAFDDPEVGAAYGRQLPRPGAGGIERHARIFNYPPASGVRSAADIPHLGLKAAFISNSFAAYRRSALQSVGGFPPTAIVSEDTFVAARMLLAGWKLAYCAEAQVFHSHRYTAAQEFQRYFDIGVFHAHHPWVRQCFGRAEGEGMRFLRSELIYLAGHAPLLIASALIRLPLRYLGFLGGLWEAGLPPFVKRRLSMQKAFWSREGQSRCNRALLPPPAGAEKESGTRC